MVITYRSMSPVSSGIEFKINALICEYHYFHSISRWNLSPSALFAELGPAVECRWRAPLRTNSSAGACCSSRKGVLKAILKYRWTKAANIREQGVQTETPPEVFLYIGALQRAYASNLPLIHLVPFPSIKMLETDNKLVFLGLLKSPGVLLLYKRSVQQRLRCTLRQSWSTLVIDDRPPWTFNMSPSHQSSRLFYSV